MTLGEVIQRYCDDHGLSHRKLAEKTGFTHGYISMLVRNVNPKTGQPIKPSARTYKRIATAMGITVEELFEQLDEEEIPLVYDNDDDIAFALAGETHKMTRKEKMDVLRYAQFINSQKKE